VFFFPSHTWTFETPASIQTVEERIRELIRIKRFNGEVHGNEFELEALIEDSDTTGPEVVGSFEPLPSGTLVRLTMRVPPLTLVAGAVTGLIFGWLVYQRWRAGPIWPLVTRDGVDRLVIPGAAYLISLVVFLVRAIPVRDLLLTTLKLPDTPNDRERHAHAG
jgi:hypothetical protein